MNDITSNELVSIEPATALTVFTTPGAIDPLLQRVRSEIDKFEADASTDKGRKAIASMAYKVARAKTYLDDAGKALADQQKEIPKKIDACRKQIRDTLDKWKDEVRAPLTEWENAEKARVDGHKQNIAALSALWQVEGLDSTGIRRRLAQADGFPLDESCEEFLAEYAAEKEAAVASLRKSLAARETFEQEQAELARLRAAEVERQRKEHEERIAREAAERARLEAERKVTAERQAAERRELELRLQAEQAERRAAEAEAKAKRDAEAKAKAEAEAAAKRAANLKHRSSIINEAIKALVAGGVDKDSARDAIDLIVNGQVPRVSVQF
jgi:septal ring factor EnvC (AmiA/AmiB activator)